MAFARQSLALALFCAGCSGATFQVEQALEDDPDTALAEDTFEPDQGQAPDTLPHAPDASEESLPDTRPALDTHKAPDVPADSYEAGASDASDAFDAPDAPDTPEAVPDAPADTKPACGGIATGDFCYLHTPSACCSGKCVKIADECCGIGHCVP